MQALNDPAMLEDIRKFITALIEVGEEYFREEIKAVHEGYAQYKAGKTFSQDETQAQFQEWLKGKYDGLSGH